MTTSTCVVPPGAIVPAAGATLTQALSLVTRHSRGAPPTLARRSVRGPASRPKSKLSSARAGRAAPESGRAVPSAAGVSTGTRPTAEGAGGIRASDGVAAGTGWGVTMTGI